ncbi:MAG: hypothetical protein R3Y46_04470 [Opitutales bacterium]
MDKGDKAKQDLNEENKGELPFFLILIILSFMLFLCWITCRFIFGSML